MYLKTLFAVLILIGLSSFEDETTDCIEVQGRSYFIHDRSKTYTDNLANTSVTYEGIDTFTFDVVLKNGKYNSGVSEGHYTLTPSSISFKESKDFCPPTADCLYPFGNRTFEYICDNHSIILIPDFKNGPESYSGSRYTITYETFDQRIIIEK